MTERSVFMTCMEAEKMVIPYINDELSPTDMENFLDHIEHCENCREELEIHYLVDEGLKKLDEAEGTYDIVGDLHRKLGDTGRILQKYLAFQVCRHAVGTLTGIALLVIFLMQIRIWHETGFLFF